MSDQKLTVEEWARQMGKKRSASMTREERKDLARKAAKKRWANARRKPKPKDK